MSCAGTDELEPPWARYPWIPLGSIGWRMGSGEGYMMEWGDYVDGAFTTAESAIEYLERHPPAPRSWEIWISHWLSRVAGVPIDDDAEDDSPLDQRIREAGLTADDAAYPVFVRNAFRGDGMEVPWATSDTPFQALRYSSRELGWWARWLATECPDRVAYLDAQPAPNPSWIAIERSARTGVSAVPWETGGIEALVCTLAATGTLPPPWLAGHEPRGSIEYDDTADDRDRWLWWVTDTFEDTASWQRYLAAWPSAPESWTKGFRDHYLELR